MSVELDLLRAIAADPANDATRLVYADWLTERGDPRGELIQLELAVGEMDDFDDRKKPATARIAELLETHGATWLAPFAKLKLRGVRFTFDRGIVAGVTGSARALAAAARGLAAAPGCVAAPRAGPDLRRQPRARAQAAEARTHTPVRTLSARDGSSPSSS